MVLLLSLWLPMLFFVDVVAHVDIAVVLASDSNNDDNDSRSNTNKYTKAKKQNRKQPPPHLTISTKLKNNHFKFHVCCKTTNNESMQRCVQG